MPLQKIGSEFMPPLWEGDLLYMPTTFPGISITKAKELLRALIAWRARRNVPNTFVTEASLNLVDDRELLDLHPQHGIFQFGPHAHQPPEPVARDGLAGPDPRRGQRVAQRVAAVVVVATPVVVVPAEGIVPVQIVQVLDHVLLVAADPARQGQQQDPEA